MFMHSFFLVLFLFFVCLFVVVVVVVVVVLLLFFWGGLRLCFRIEAADRRSAKSSRSNSQALVMDRVQFL